MNKLLESIPKQPVLKAAQDYYRLRREGIGFIEKMASSLWTDYNTHDPGITILESLCYAITDLAYRIAWDINDLLAPETPSTDPNQPFPNQAFFTAREILTVNPVTPEDFRHLLCDLPCVRNAWVLCKTCSCDIPFYALCKDDQLQLSFKQPDTAKPIKINGLYDILLEPEEGEADQAVKQAKALLHQHRNLAEDYCRINVIGSETVAVCADIEVSPDADIERVQAGVWFAIERYFNRV